MPPTSRPHHRQLLLIAVAVGLVLVAPEGLASQGPETEAPALSLRATPRVGFSPLEVVLFAELRGGSDDHEPFYCASVEWDWDDDTRSETTPDCDPYEAGVSKVRRRYSNRHTFRRGGTYEVRFSLKRGDDVVASARTRIEVRGSARPFR